MKLGRPVSGASPFSGIGGAENHSWSNNLLPPRTAVSSTAYQPTPASDKEHLFSDYSPMKKTDPNTPYAQRQKMMMKQVEQKI